jgi:PWI domain
MRMPPPPGHFPPNNTPPTRVLLTQVPRQILVDPDSTSSSNENEDSTLLRHEHNHVYYRRLREWFQVIGGPIRQAHFFFESNTSRKDGKIKDNKYEFSQLLFALNQEEDPNPKNDGGMSVVITASHADMATTWVAVVRKWASMNENVPMAAHLVPVMPEIPLPPIMLDPVLVEQLAERFQQRFLEMTTKMPSDSKAATEAPAVNAPTAVVAPVPVPTPVSAVVPAPAGATPSTSPTKKQDKFGMAEENALEEEDDVDPLETPEVLAAVKAFRQRLATQQGTKSIRRQQLVQDQLLKLLPQVRRDRELQRQQQQQNLPLPPPPGHGALLPPPPPALGLPLPPLPTATGLPPGLATGAAPRRGVSNLPAWMTSQQPTDGAKRDRWEQSFPKVSQADSLRNFIGGLVQKYLDVTETTLVNFCLDQISSGTTPRQLEQELRETLEDDATAFVESIVTEMERM